MAAKKLDSKSSIHNFLRPSGFPSSRQARNWFKWPHLGTGPFCGSPKPNQGLMTPLYSRSPFGLSFGHWLDCLVPAITSSKKKKFIGYGDTSEQTGRTHHKHSETISPTGVSSDLDECGEDAFMPPHGAGLAHCPMTRERLFKLDGDANPIRIPFSSLSLPSALPPTRLLSVRR